MPSGVQHVRLYFVPLRFLPTTGIAVRSSNELWWLSGVKALSKPMNLRRVFGEKVMRLYA